MEILGCLGFVFVLGILAVPFVTLSLWRRVRELEYRVVELSRKVASAKFEGVSAENKTYEAVLRLQRSHKPIEPSSLQPIAPMNATIPPSKPESIEITEFEAAPIASADAIVADAQFVPPPLPVVTQAVETSVEPVHVVQQVHQENTAGPDLSETSRPDALLPSPPSDSIEEILAGKWLAYVGALAVMIGAGFGLKYAIDNQWLGPVGRVVLGIVVGWMSFAGGAFAMRKDYRFLGQSLTGAALGILYLSFYAAFDWYHILSYEWAFAGMVLTTAGGLAFAHAFDSQPTAVLGMIGGFITPAMLPPSSNSIWELFPYLLLLDVGVLCVSSLRRWTGLQVLVFLGTIITWIAWYVTFYTQELLFPTLGFLTVFFALFAALGVIHNIVQKRVAEAGDFFLILTTPVVYFAVLYWLTYEIWPYEQGYFALAMTAIYTVFAIAAGRLNPIGKSVTTALAGLAGTFLILAPPLSLTGHWVTVAWIAESVLLVELGLRFELASLKWTGLSLLAKVQFILMIYGIGTLADPVNFQTAFVRQTLHLSAPHEERTLAWTDVFNNRSYSYFVDILGFCILAWEFRRRSKFEVADDKYGPSQNDLELWLTAGVPIVGLLLGLLEVFVWGMLRNWHGSTILSVCSIWTSLVVVATVAWSVRVGPRAVERVAWTFFVLMVSFLGITAIWTIQAIDSKVEIAKVTSSFWLINPRGIGFLSALISLMLTAVIYQVERLSQENQRDLAAEPKSTGISIDVLFGCMAYWLGLAMVLLETYVWGMGHSWNPGTIVFAFSLWTGLFAIGLVNWQTRLSRALDKAAADFPGAVPGIAQEPSAMIVSVFLILGVLLVVNSAITLTGIQSRNNVTWDSIQSEWWLLNPRGIGFAFSCAVSAISAWLIERDRRLNQTGLSLLLGSASYVAGLAAVLLETFVWGTSHEWLPGTILSVLAMWTAAFGAGLILWRVRLGSESLDTLVESNFALLGLFLLLISFGTFNHPTWLRHNAQPPLDELWMLNPRGLGFLMSIAAAGFAATLYRGLARDLSNQGSYESKGTNRSAILFGLSAFFSGLIFVLLETAVWGIPREWMFGTLLSTSAMWTSMFAAGLAIWAASSRDRHLDHYVIGVYLLLGGFVVLAGIIPFNRNLEFYGDLKHSVEYEWWFLNPRAMGFLMGIAATGLAAAMYRRVELALPRNITSAVTSAGVMTLSEVLGVSAYLGGFALVTTEAFAQGTTRQWLTGTSLAVTIAWTLYATGTLVAGIYWRTATVRILSLLLFVLTIGKVFLVDIWHLETVIRVFAFLSLGVALILVSFLYRRFRDRIREWVLPTTASTDATM